MNRHLKIISALLVLLILGSLLLVASAQTDPNSLLISNVAAKQESGAFTVEVTVQNAGDAAIDEFGLAFVFLDPNGNTVYEYASTLDGFAKEDINFYYTSDPAINPGSAYVTQDVFTGHDNAMTVAVALRYFHPVNGAYIGIPESQWQWLWPGDTQTVSSLDGSYYMSPPDSLYADISGINNGFYQYYLNGFNAPYYGKIQGGLWLSYVEDGSFLSSAGLRAGDLILFADGVDITENYYAFDTSLAAALAGEKVDWVYERDGVIHVARLSQP
jgi:hypothetical protein